MKKINQKDRDRMAKLLRAARICNGYCQFEIARKLGVTQSMVSKLETGILMPDVGYWYKFCQELAINPDKSYYAEDIVPENIKGKSGKNLSTGDFLSKYLVNSSEFLLYYHAVSELNLLKEFGDFLNSFNVDLEIFLTPNLKVSLDILTITFDFLVSYTDEEKLVSLLSDLYANKHLKIEFSRVKSLRRIIKEVNELEKLVIFKVQSSEFTLNINKNFDDFFKENYNLKALVLHIKKECFVKVYNKCDILIDHPPIKLILGTKTKQFEEVA